MRPVPRRFLIAYAAAFGLLCGLGLFVAGLSADAHWIQNPFVQRKIDPAFDDVEVSIIRKDSGEMEYIAMRSLDEGLPSGHQRMPYDEDGYLGSVWILQSWYSSVAAPFVTRTDTYLKAGLGSDDSASIPEDAIQTAKSIAYEKACLWLDIPHFYKEDFYYREPPAELEWVLGGILLQDSLEPLIPIWLIPVLFALLPFFIAWAFTSATTRSKQADSPPSPLAGEGGSAAAG